MKVTCELEIGNNQKHAGKHFFIEGYPGKPRGFIHIHINGTMYEIRPSELIAAVERTRSDLPIGVEN